MTQVVMRARPRGRRWLVTIGVAVVSFYMGVLVGMHVGRAESNVASNVNAPIINSNSNNDLSKDPRVLKIVQEKVQAALARQATSKLKNQKEKIKQNRKQNRGDPGQERRLGDQVTNFAVGMARTGRDDLFGLVDTGYPNAIRDNAGTLESLIIYNQEKALPTNPGMAEAAMYADENGIPRLSAADATLNCDVLQIAMVSPSQKLRQCLAVVGHYEAAHLQRWMRVKPTKTGSGHIDSTLPLSLVGRGNDGNGLNSFTPPVTANIKENWKLLRKYLNTIDSTLKVLKPIAQKVAKRNTVIVMVCNLGQSELLVNFVCAAKSRNLDISNILLFATDQETHDIGVKLGMTVYYDKNMFENFPEGEAKRYGDKNFTFMMCAKVITVQIVNFLGFDVLFQDVDVVWYKNPLEQFHDEHSELQEFDIIFQDDGARSLRFAPHSANTGFYYVRYNSKTKYLFTSLLYVGDSVMATKSHQQTLTALLSEHSSLYGLKVKTLSGEDFPGGFHYHRRNQLMHEIVEGKRTPWIFHMSWTNNKKHKVLFFQQMGLWYVHDQCRFAVNGVTTDVVKKATGVEDLTNQCCSAEALFTCHYKDKPSIKPCPDSPNLDEGRRSFWK